MDITIKRLTSPDISDFVALIHVFEDVFEMEGANIPDHAYLQHLLAAPNFITIVAKTGDDVVGGLTAYVLDQYYTKKPLVYIYDLAVLREFQRQGIGKKLISYINAFCKEKGAEEVFVQADKVDDYALDFYRSTNATNEEEVVHFYYTL